MSNTQTNLETYRHKILEIFKTDTEDNKIPLIITAPGLGTIHTIDEFAEENPVTIIDMRSLVRTDLTVSDMIRKAKAKPKLKPVLILSDIFIGTTDMLQKTVKLLKTKPDNLCVIMISYCDDESDVLAKETEHNIVIHDMHPEIKALQLH